jgi:hypothetical protein
VSPEHFGAAIGESRAEHLPRRLFQRGWIKVRRGKIDYRNTPTGREPSVGDIDHARPRLCGELAQDERHHDESGGCPLRACINCTRVEMCSEAVCDQSPTRTF